MKTFLCVCMLVLSNPCENMLLAQEYECVGRFNKVSLGYFYAGTHALKVDILDIRYKYFGAGLLSLWTKAEAVFVTDLSAKFGDKHESFLYLFPLSLYYPIYSTPMTSLGISSRLHLFPVGFESEASTKFPRYLDLAIRYEAPLFAVTAGHRFESVSWKVGGVVISGFAGPFLEIMVSPFSTTIQDLKGEEPEPLPQPPKGVEWEMNTKTEEELMEFLVENKKVLDPIEGIWLVTYSDVADGFLVQENPAHARVAILRDSLMPGRDFVQICLVSSVGFIQKAVSAYFTRTSADSVYRSVQFDPDGSSDTWKFRVDESGLLSGSRFRNLHAGQTYSYIHMQKQYPKP